MKKKLLSLGVVLTMLALIVGGTLAYFTDTTDTKENVFTVGKVDIELTEPNWNIDEEEVFVGHIVPGRIIEKDPTITVDTDSEDAWVFMEVEMNKYASFLKLVGLNEGWKDGDVWAEWNAAVTKGAYTKILDKWFKDVDHGKWKVMNLPELIVELEKMATGQNPVRLTLKLGYKGTLTANEKVTLFTGLTIPKTVTSTMLEDSKFNSLKNEWRINITGKAIQAEGLVTLQEAYEALYE